MDTPWTPHVVTDLTDVPVRQLLVFYSRAMGGNLRTVLMRHLDVMRQNPKLDIDAIVANPNMTIYEFDTLITSRAGQFVRTESPLFILFWRID